MPVTQSQRNLTKAGRQRLPFFLKMALNLTKISNTFSNLLQQIPITVTFDGDDYTGTKTITSNDDIYLDEGFQEKYLFTVHLLQADFDTLPTMGDLVTISSVEYRVLSIETDTADVGIKLNLGEKYSRD